MSLLQPAREVTAGVDLNDWISIVEREYLRDFIPSGGAAVKFAVVRPPLARQEVQAALKAAATKSGFQFAYVDSASTKIHMIDHLFKAVAKQVDWDGFAATFLRQLLEDNGLRLPPAGQRLEIHVVASLNNSDAKELRRDIKGWLNERILRDFAMAQEFRIAMVRLCQAQVEGGESEALDAANIKDWLRGDLKLLSALKSALIYQKIARYNARDMFLSLAHWLKLAGKKGLILALDIARYTEPRKWGVESDGSLYHGPTVAMDAYEVLRQFIDSTDEMESCFLTVIAPPEFLEDEKRGLPRYEALRLRVWDEVRDRRQPNPLSSLIRLTRSS